MKATKEVVMTVVLELTEEETKWLKSEMRKNREEENTENKNMRVNLLLELDKVLPSPSLR